MLEKAQGRESFAIIPNNNTNKTKNLYNDKEPKKHNENSIIS